VRAIGSAGEDFRNWPARAKRASSVASGARDPRVSSSSRPAWFAAGTSFPCPSYPCAAVVPQTAEMTSTV